MPLGDYCCFSFANLYMQAAHASLEHWRKRLFTSVIRRNAELATASMASLDVLPSPDVVPSEQQLCDRCLGLDFTKFFEDTLDYGDNFFPISTYYISLNRLEKPAEPIGGGVCPLCIILSRAIDDPIAGTAAERDQENNVELMACHASYLEFWTHHKVQDERLLQLCFYSDPLPWYNSRLGFYREQARRCCIVIERSLGQSEPLVKTCSESFDADVARDWIARCQNDHEKECSPSTQPIDDLYLIDCHNGTVVAAKEQPAYVALSYVWAPPSDESANYHLRYGENCGSPLPDNLPLVVADAMIVTRSLGLRYLWVDKFCIAQDQLEVKHGQIKQMDLVYSNAELVIIAAAGQDENYGLPGVSSRPRVVTPTIETKGVRVSWFQQPDILIKESKWNTRGWTYQEAFLARRRLVFFDDQMYFECQDEFNLEAVPKLPADYDYRIWEVSDRSRFSFLDYNINLVGQYTARELSYDSDSLLAFAGVLNKLRKAHPYLKHVWGIPYVFKDPYDLFELPPETFTWGLCWTHTQNCWDGPEKPRRRRTITSPSSATSTSMLPSWAWAGWAGQVEYKSSLGHDQTFSMFAIQICDIHLEDPHGNAVALRRIAELGDIFEMFRYPILCIETWAVPPDKILESAYRHAVTLLSLSEGADSMDELFDKLSDTEGQWRCIFLGTFRDDNVVGHSIIFLIVRKETDQDLWVRVGILELHTNETVGIKLALDDTGALNRSWIFETLTAMGFSPFPAEKFKIK
ncbi:HET-domain-containing protein [Daldinia bambusicola]|nr:HET-domain-containing protein [Daldinia bambusicola]